MDFKKSFLVLFRKYIIMGYSQEEARYLAYKSLAKNIKP